jgi:surface antigen
MKNLAAMILALTLVAPTLAAPPDHAPAHGYRNKPEKHAGKYRGYTGVEWEQDYGVAAGRCNTDSVLTVLGATGGALIGNRTASPENRTIATIVGAIAGGLIGNAVGDAIDDGDRACIGHSLEVGAIGRDVTWTNPRTHVVQTVRPVRDLAGGCRLFDYQAGPRAKVATLTACRTANAAWTIRR